MSPIPDRVRSLQDVRWSGTLVTSVLAIAIATAVAATEIPGLLSAASTSSWSDEGADAFAAVDEAHQRQADVSTRRFSGRSPFVVPRRPGTRPAPPPPRREPERRPDPPEQPRVETGPPANYTGTKPVGVAAELVFFEDGKQILVGDDEGGITVLGILGPGKVRLGHLGGDYEVDFLAGNTSNLFTEFRPGRNVASALGDPPAPRGDATGPSPGDRVRAVTNRNGQRRVVTGRIESVTGPNGSRVMRIRPEGGGNVITIPQSDMVSFETLDDTIGRLPEDAGEDEPQDPESEHPIPPPASTEEFRAMSPEDLGTAYDSRALALRNEGLDHPLTVRLQNEMTVIHDLLRPPPPPRP